MVKMGVELFRRLSGCMMLLFLLAGCGHAQAMQAIPLATAVPFPTLTAGARPTNSPVSTEVPTTTPVKDSIVSHQGLPLHTIDIILDHRERRMQVTHHIHLHNATQAVWERVVFSVPSAYAPQVFTLQSTEVTTLRQRQTVTADLDNTMLSVRIPGFLKPGETASIQLIYLLHIPSVAPSTWLPEGNLGAGESIIQAGDWHPTLVPYSEEEGWQTWEYYPVGDPTVYPLADYDVRIFTDPSVVVAAPGERKDTGTAHYFKLVNARSFAFTASAAYHVLEKTVDGIPISVYYLLPYADAAQAVLKTTSLALPFFSSIYGPYPTSGLVIAQNAYYGSMEYSGFISMSDYAYRIYNADPTSLLVNLTIHEIAHQWWYGSVGNNQVDEPWLDESFAKYSELLFYERFTPEVVPWWWENHVNRLNPGGPIDVPIYDFPSTIAYIHQVYSQGARFMGDLRAHIGDTQFFTFLKAYQAYGKFRIVTREDFFKVLDTCTDADLTELVDRYFSTAPEYE